MLAENGTTTDPRNSNTTPDVAAERRGSLLGVHPQRSRTVGSTSKSRQLSEQQQHIAELPYALEQINPHPPVTIPDRFAGRHDNAVSLHSRIDNCQEKVGVTRTLSRRARRSAAHPPAEVHNRQTPQAADLHLWASNKGRQRGAMAIGGAFRAVGSIPHPLPCPAVSAVDASVKHSPAFRADPCPRGPLRAAECRHASPVPTRVTHAPKRAQHSRALVDQRNQ